jgi:hypothetical protein
MSEVSGPLHRSSSKVANSIKSSLMGTNGISSIHDLHMSIETGSRPAERTFRLWRSLGCRFAYLAGGGSVYILLMIAGLDLRWSISRAQVPVTLEVANLLRRPDDSSAGRLICKRVIPTVAYLRENLPLSLEGLCCFDARKALDCTALKDSDRCFSGIKFRCVASIASSINSWGRCATRSFGLPHRSYSAWKPCLEPIWDNFLSFNSMADGDGPDIVMDDDLEGPGFQIHKEPEEEESLCVVVVHTGFDSSSPDNKRFPAPHDHQLNIAWTKRERKLAEAGEFVEDMDDLRDKVSH